MPTLISTRATTVPAAPRPCAPRPVRGLPKLSVFLLFGALSLAACGDDPPDAAGQAFLDKAAAEEGAIRTESGLIYKQLKAGYGPKPEDGDKVTVHYTGSFIDGTVFDSSVERRKPSTFSLNRVIKGWTEGLKMMKGGGKARLVIPPHLAYGPRGKPPKIPPSATLVFEVELLGIQ